ncbi:dock180, putative [Babesia ovis]|uniref:Dock180, putative n=1 Tax=Babesia ovis TaxID=5869 RepID=A0A9W5TAJ8_BABOV|nr:dock180, putative [Babesia ovis]
MLLPFIAFLLGIVGNKSVGCQKERTKSHVIKWVGNYKEAQWLAETEGDFEDNYIYYDIDLYYNESIDILCPSIPDQEPRLDPIDEGLCYNIDTFQNVGKGMDDDNGEVSYRIKRKIKDIAGNLVVKKMDDIGSWQISFVGEPYHYGIETLYFDCTIEQSEETILTATLKVNVMPLYYAIPSTDKTLDFNKTHSPYGTPIVYFKYPRHDTTLDVSCSGGATAFGLAGGSLFRSRRGEVASSKTLKLDFRNKSNIVRWNNDQSVICVDVKYKIFQLIRQTSTKVKEIYWLENFADTNAGNLRLTPIEHKIAYFYQEINQITLTPRTCIQHFLWDMTVTLKAESFVNDFKYTWHSRNLAILDLSQYHTYRLHNALCASRNKRQSTITIPFFAVCDFDNPDSLDLDGKTCSVFITNNDYVIVRGVMSKGHPLTLTPDKDAKMHLKNDTPPDTNWDETLLKVEKAVDIDEIKLTNTPNTSANEVFLKFEVKGVSHNPRYYVWHEGSFDEHVQHGKIIAVHFCHDYILFQNNADRLKYGGSKIKGQEPGTTKIFSLVIREGENARFHCKDLFSDAKNTEFVLYPPGKNTYFVNVEDNKADISTLPTSQFQEDFATYGVSIYKSPEAMRDANIQFEYTPDAKIWAIHKRPLYFACVPKVYDPLKNSIGFVGIDPYYQPGSLYGCGTRPEFFLDDEGKRNTKKHCDFTLSRDFKVGFYCPTPIPQHFLDGDQSQFSPPEDSDITQTNPYHTMMKCVDRSTRIQNLLKPRETIDIFEPMSVGEVRSLWIFSQHLFWKNGKQVANRILCTCYNTKGERVASIYISAGFTKVGRHK